MFRVDKGRDTASFLRLGKYVKGNGGLSAALRAKYFHDAPTRNAADAKSNVERKDTA